MPGSWPPLEADTTHADLPKPILMKEDLDEVRKASPSMCTWTERLTRRCIHFWCTYESALLEVHKLSSGVLG